MKGGRGQFVARVRLGSVHQRDIRKVVLSRSLVDQIGIPASLGDDPATRSITELSTTGFIAEDAAHWAIEPHIPLDVDTLSRYLIARNEWRSGTEPFTAERFHAGRERILGAVDADAGERLRKFGAAFRRVDPDADDVRQVVDDRAPAAIPPDDVEQAIEVCTEMLSRAGYTQLKQQQIEAAVGVASAWGVPLTVDFDRFSRLVVFARGDVVGQRLRRRLRNLYRSETVDVPIYQRVVVIFVLEDDQTAGEPLASSVLHLRLFKNIPKQDVDMLLPGGKVRISTVDRAKVFLPSLGGLLVKLPKLLKLTKVVIVLFALALHWTLILIAVVVGYAAKSVFSYFQTRNKYQLNLTRNLYFQKLDTNAGVGFRLIEHATRQQSLQCLLAFFAIGSAQEPISRRKLRRRCERLIRELIGVEVAFRVDESVEALIDGGLVHQVDGKLAIAPQRELETSPSHPD